MLFCHDRSESDENGESQEQKDYKREFFDMLDEVNNQFQTKIWFTNDTKAKETNGA